MSRLRVLVLMGGFSSEHDVSVVSGTGIIRAIHPKKYNVHPVLIQKDGTWIWSSRELTPYQKENFSLNYFLALEGKSACKKKNPALSELPDSDIAFLALHGKWGEDGRVQALLENWKIPYTGCGVLASALAMDKIKSKEIYAFNKIATPAHRVLHRNSFSGDQLVSIADELKFPLVIKDPTGGSSLGMGIANDLEESEKIISELFQNSNTLLCEQYIQGREFSCAYIEGEKPLFPTELRMTTRKFFDFEAKYNGECEEITPAPLTTELTEQIQKLTQKAHESLSASVYSRTDFLMDSSEKIWAIETNTLPGFTPTSLLPQQAAHNGISYSELIDIIIQKSLKVTR